jgi:hypothetical protein
MRSLWVLGVAGALLSQHLVDGRGGVEGEWVEGSPAFARQLQDNATNATEPVVSACMQAIRDLGNIEQCEIDYRAADCPEAEKKNWVPWVTLDSSFVLLHIFGVLVMFLSLSIVCDEYFVPGARTASTSILALGRSRVRTSH